MENENLAAWCRRCAALVLSPAALLFCVQLITLGEPGRAAGWVPASPAAAALSWLFLLACIALFTALTGRVWAGYALTALPTILLAMANYLKLAFNSAPLYYSDLAMAAHLNTLTGFITPQLKLGGWVIAALLISLAVLPALILLEWPLPSPGWVGRLLMLPAAAALAAAVLLVPRGYLAGTPGLTQGERCGQFGLLAGLYSGYLNRQAQAPENYGSESLEQVLEQAEPSAEPSPPEEPEEAPVPVVHPSVVMLMSESFCDPAEVLPGVSFAADPIPCFHRLAEQWPTSVFLSNTYSGGTGNVEMEVLTGLSTAFLTEGDDLTTLPSEVYGRLPSIVRAFGAAGYETRFIHNYNRTFYDRAEHMPLLGFDTLTFEDDLPEDAPRSGSFLSDMALTDAITAAFAERGPDDSPLFIYAVSMENHQPYHPDKFDQPSGLEPSCEALSKPALETVDALVQGLRGADRALEALLDWLEKLDEPVLVVFWGDHMPGLYVDDSSTVYSMLGRVSTSDTLQWDAADIMRMQETAFLLWNNYEARQEIPALISANSLGDLVLDWAGVEKPLYFRWLDRALDTVLLYRKRLYVRADGVPYAEPPQEDQALIEDYGRLVYDLVYGDGLAAERISALP